tara:strand:+ start:107 stop:1375 length:1269 start_codon:yes stop_codon:yes gene_type:complete
MDKRLIGVVGVLLLVLVVVSVAQPSLFEFLNPVKKSPLPETTTVYAYGANGLVSKQKGSEVSYYHSDNLGSSALVTDSSGNVKYSTDYYPFGSSLHEEGKEKYTYNSKELDNTGLYYYGARYYDASVGRFISVDPMAGDIFNPQRLNRYSYVMNNPLKYVDVNGEDNQDVKNTYLAINVGVPIVTAIYKGVQRGDDFETILKNSLIAGTSSAGSFYLKSNIGNLEKNNVPFVAIKAGNDVLTSVMNNAIRGSSTFSSITFDIFSPVRGNYGDGEFSLALDYGKTIDSILMTGMALTGMTQLDFKKSIATGSLFGHRSTNLGGSTVFPHGGAIHTIPFSETHEKIHQLQFSQFTKYGLALQDQSEILSSDNAFGLNMFRGSFETLPNFHKYTQGTYRFSMAASGFSTSPYGGITYEGEAEALE